MAENTRSDTSRVAIGPAVRPGQRAKNTKKGSLLGSDKLGIRPAHALNPILAIFGMWGGPPDVFLKF